MVRHWTISVHTAKTFEQSTFCEADLAYRVLALQSTNAIALHAMHVLIG